MELADLLVSYKLVLPEVEEKEIELPIDRYLRMIQYINTKKPKEEPPKENSEQPSLDSDDFGFNGWDYSGIESTAPSLVTSFKSNSDWANQLSNSYRKLGLSENAIKNLIAKNAHESGWGKSALGKYNYGNITTGKYWNGNYIDGNDHNAAGQAIKQKFRSYNSMDEFAKDELNFLTRLYDFNPNDDFETFINKLLGKNKDKRRYAEDLQYVDKIRNVYNKLS